MKPIPFILRPFHLVLCIFFLWSSPALSQESQEALPAPAGNTSAFADFLRKPSIQSDAGRIDVSAIWTQSFNYFSRTPTFRLDAHEPHSTQDGFSIQLQELELALQAFVDPHVRADIFLAFGRDGVEIEEGYLTTLDLPAGLQFKAGQFYAPFGRFNTLHFLEVTPFADMPLANRRFFSGENLRGLGLQGSILLPLPWYAEIIGAFQTADNESSFGVPADETSGLDDFVTTVHLKQYWDLTDNLYFQFGGSFTQGPNDSGGPANRKYNRTRFWGTDLYLKWRDTASSRYLAFQAEYIARLAELPGGSLSEGGLYSWLEARFHRHWGAAVRFDYQGVPSELKGPNPPVFVNTELAPFHSGTEQWRAGISGSWYLSEFFRLRLQYNYDKERLPGVNGVHEVFGQFQFGIGAHGAHPF